MDLFVFYKKLLLTQKVQPSKVTVKNYLSDLRHFVRWYEDLYRKSFHPDDITAQIITRYAENAHTAARSKKRHLSSLKKFFSLLQEQELCTNDPFQALAQNQQKEEKEEDIWHLKEFREYLYVNGASHLTIKNYIIDIQHFAQWAEKTVLQGQKVQNPFEKVNALGLETYKERLLTVVRMSPKSVNRKLSSLRKYGTFLKEKNLISDSLEVINTKVEQNIGSSLSLEDLQKLEKEQPKTYSPLPPVRLVQRLAEPIEEAEEKVADLITTQIQQNKFEGIGKIKEKLAQETALHPERVPTNISKAFYAPTQVSTHTFPLHKKVLHHARHTRPKWYKRYHNHTFTHYLHVSVLVIYASIVGLGLYKTIISDKGISTPVFAQKMTHKTLFFSGRLLSPDGRPVTVPTRVTFAIYNDLTSSDKSTLLWQETHEQVEPNEDGTIHQTIGMRTPIPQSIFDNANNLYLGVTIADNPELSPRQRLTTTSFAADADMLSGMKLITQTNKTANVVLALDSSGDLTIGGNANPVFQATGGEFTLKGTAVVLTTNTGSDGNLTLAPDGLGKIDLQKSLVNSTEDSALQGAVTVEDRFVVTSSESARAVFSVNNNYLGGDLFTASSSGITKFVIDTFGHVGIGTNRPTYHLDVQGDTRITGKTILNNVAYSWPSLAGKKGSVLSYNGMGDLSWVDPATLSHWQEQNNVISLANTRADFLVGGDATSSAKFALTGVNSNAATAYFTADITLRGGNRKITTDGGNLTLGDTRTGTITLAPQGKNALTASKDGLIGIGTIPSLKLDVLDTQTATAAALITNSNSGSNADVLALKVGTTTPGTGNYFASFLNGQGAVIGKIQGNGAGGVVYSTSGSDFAEYFKKEHSYDVFEPGDIVCIGATGGASKCTSAQDTILGIVSDRPGFVGGGNHDSDPNYILVGLIGQLPVKVTPLSGTIRPGDPITVQKEFGTAQTATTKSSIVGYALASYSPEDGDSTVMVRLSTGSYLPETNLFDRFTASVASIGHLVAGNIQTTTLQASKIVTDTLVINGKNIQDYIQDYITDTLAQGIVTQEIISPIATINTLKTNTITSTDKNSTVALELTDTKLNVKNTSSGSANIVASLDNQGNATFSGSLTAQDASISGTLHADIIDAKTISGLEDKVASIASTLLKTNNQAQNNHSNKSTDNLLTATLPPLEPELDMDYLDISTFSAQFALITESLTALGPATFNNLTVMDTFSIGTNFLFSNQSIDVLGDDLEIQPLRQGGISFLADKIKFDVSGNAYFAENATFAKDVQVGGKLAAGILSPLPDQDLVIHLPQKGDGSNAQFVIENAQREPVLSINAKGDLSASGSARFAQDIIASGSAYLAKLNLLAKPAQAVSDNEMIASGSAGTATLKAYNREITIHNEQVTEDSLIYITPVGDTRNQVVSLLRQVPGRSFTVGISKAIPTDILFNWIIIN